MKIIEESLEKESNAYSLFVYAIRSQITRDYYLRRLRIFFNHINLEPDKTIVESVTILQLSQPMILHGHLIPS